MFEACIEMDVDSDCAFDHHHVTMVRARKVLVCEECGGEIKRGDMYEYCYATQIVGYMNADGRWCERDDIFIFRTCWICLAILRDFGSNDARMYGVLWDEMREIYGISSPDELPEWDEDDEEMWDPEQRKQVSYA